MVLGAHGMFSYILYKYHLQATAGALTLARPTCSDPSLPERIPQIRTSIDTSPRISFHYVEVFPFLVL